MTSLAPAARVLELGPATGIATGELADRCGHLVAVELGTHLAAEARHNLAHRDDVEIVCASFDVWEPPTWGEFDLAVAASCWHWMDPDTRYQRACRHLRPGGHLAFWSATHVIPIGGDPLFAELQAIYDEIGESRPGEWVEIRPGEIPDRRDEIAASGCFELVGVEQFDWEVTYGAEDYIDLLNTFSGHIAMEPRHRERLYDEIRRRLAERSDRRLRRHYGAVLHVARMFE